MDKDDINFCMDDDHKCKGIVHKYKYAAMCRGMYVNGTQKWVGAFLHLVVYIT
jgi:hypothetical protein